ncbi:hypothetical protein DPMN_083433 [Dreissena polymorpha]|uniref:Uncharacterized protein n=1 Tax=Dreissena polymorpha TaxID=45954 RepID=A0A9D3YCU4_DREPO|nr:hypothetical protein DPMN_083433 [Dreissena polymorpha]
MLDLFLTNSIAVTGRQLPFLISSYPVTGRQLLFLISPYQVTGRQLLFSPYQVTGRQLLFLISSYQVAGFGGLQLTSVVNHTNQPLVKAGTKNGVTEQKGPAL